MRFTLRASGLPALDRNLFSKDSSDPYFKLKARDGNGFLHPLGQSKVLSKNLNPEWEPVEVSAEALGSYRRLHIEVWDHDVGLDDDQIGVYELDLPKDLGAALGEGEPPLETSFDIPTRPLTGPLADVYHGGVGTLEGSYTLVERGAAAPAPAPKKKRSIFGRKPISPPPSPPAETSAPEISAGEISVAGISAPEISVANISAAEISRLEAKLEGLREQEAVLHGEVVRLRTGGMLECREAVAVACRTVEEDEKRMAEEEAEKKAAKKQKGKKGGKKQGEEAGGDSSRDSSFLGRLSGAMTGLVQDSLDNMAGVGDDFDEEAGRGGTGSEVIPVDMSDETLAWPRFVPVIRLSRRRALSDCCSWVGKNKQAFYASP